jgi:hypothetical protein
MKSLVRYEKAGMVSQEYQRYPLIQRRFYELCADRIASVMRGESAALKTPW